MLLLWTGFGLGCRSLESGYLAIFGKNGFVNFDNAEPVFFPKHWFCGCLSGSSTGQATCCFLAELYEVLPDPSARSLLVQHPQSIRP